MGPQVYEAAVGFVEEAAGIVEQTVVVVGIAWKVAVGFVEEAAVAAGLG